MSDRQPRLQLPEVEHERFAGAPLRAMLGQVRFPPILRVDDRESLAGFQDALRSEYPDLQQEDELGVRLSSEDGFTTESSRRWRLVGPDGWAVVLAAGFLTLEADPARYTGYTEFRARFADVWNLMRDTFAPSSVARQGLRYINHIQDDLRPAEWARLVNPELVGPIAGATLAPVLSQAISDYRLTLSAGTLALKHGIVPAGPDRAVGYLLDFDMYVVEVPGEASTDTVLHRFDQFHDVLYPFFLWCLTPEGIDRIREEES